MIGSYVVSQQQQLLGQDVVQPMSTRRLSVMGDVETLPPLFPLRAQAYIGFVCAVVGLIIAAGGGIGGGGILVPVYVLVMGMPVKLAIPLTSVTVLGGSVANNVLNVNKYHPDHPSRSCIDWDLILQLVPMTIAGTLIGANLNDLLPEVVLVVLLLLILSLTAYFTLQKATKMYQKETAQQQRQRQQDDEEEEEEEGRKLVATKTEAEYGSTITGGGGSHPKTDLERQDSLDVEVKKHEAWIDIVKLTGLFVVITLINLLKGGTEGGGGTGGPPGVVACGRACYWASTGTMLTIILLFALWVRRDLLDRIASGAPKISDIDWDGRNTVKYPLYAIGAGLIAGLFGIGGGMVLGPLMIALGVHPAVASATSAAIIFFTSATAAMCFMVFGLLVVDYSVACFLVGFAATVAGQTIMTVLMRQCGQRHSYVAFSIGIVVAISAVCMTAESVIALNNER
jgi:uncharacterized membrane protein YfcA